MRRFWENCESPIRVCFRHSSGGKRICLYLAFHDAVGGFTDSTNCMAYSHLPKRYLVLTDILTHRLYLLVFSQFPWLSRIGVEARSLYSMATRYMVTLRHRQLNSISIVVVVCVRLETRNPAKTSGGRPYETGSRNMAATKKMNFLTLVSYSLLQTLFG